MKYWFILLIILPLNVWAITQEDQLHIAAHAGTTYAITHVTEVFCTKAAGQEYKLTCTLTGVVLANAINIGRKIAQSLPNDSSRAIISGALGSGIAVTIIAIDW